MRIFSHFSLSYFQTLLTRIKNKIERSIRKSLFLSGMEGLLYTRKKSGDIIVMYHGVDLEGSREFNIRSISRSNLRRQLMYFKREYTLVPLKEIFEKENPGIKRMAITFDDGLQNNYKFAAPLLRRLKVPATFFVTSIREKGDSVLWPDALDVAKYYHKGNIEFDQKLFEPQPWNRYYSKSTGRYLGSYMKEFSYDKKWKLINLLLEVSNSKLLNDKRNHVYTEIMSGDEIRTLAKSPLFEIGSHSHLHNNLGFLTNEDAKEEMRTSKNYLENIIQEEVCSIAFPDGSYNLDTLKVANEIGFSNLLAVNFNNPKDEKVSNLKDRIGVYQDRSWIEQLHQINTRFYEE